MNKIFEDPSELKMRQTRGVSHTQHRFLTELIQRGLKSKSLGLQIHEACFCFNNVYGQSMMKKKTMIIAIIIVIIVIIVN